VPFAWPVRHHVCHARHGLCLRTAVHARADCRRPGGLSAGRALLPHAEALAEKFGSTLTLVRAILPAAIVAALRSADKK